MELCTLKIELNINAQKILAQLHTHNQELEAIVERGVTAAFEEIVADDNFFELIKLKTKEEVFNSVNKVVMSYSLGDALRKAFSEKLENKIQEYSEKMAEELTKHLK